MGKYNKDVCYLRLGCETERYMGSGADICGVETSRSATTMFIIIIIINLALDCLCDKLITSQQ